MIAHDIGDSSFTYRKRKKRTGKKNTPKNSWPNLKAFNSHRIHQTFSTAKTFENHKTKERSWTFERP